jgi:hypothetical protein
MEAALKQSMPRSAPTRVQARPVLSGIVTGQLAGLIMAVVVMIVFAVFLGKSPLFPVQVIGSTLYGSEALNGFHLGALLAGLLLHQLGPSLLWGVIFGIIASRANIQSTASALKVGLGLGLISMVGPYLLIPFVMHTMQGADYWNQNVPMFWDWAAHVVFGASFAIYPTVRGKLER